MKTPDEIKQALRLCDAVCCTLDCPYFRSTSTNCVKKLHKNALAYIKRLERHAEPKNRVLTLEELKVYTGFYGAKTDTAHLITKENQRL